MGVGRAFPRPPRGGQTGRFSRRFRGRKNNEKSSNGPLLFLDYYGIILAFLERERPAKRGETKTEKRKDDDDEQDDDLRGAGDCRRPRKPKCTCGEAVRVPRRAQRGALRSKVARGCARASKSCRWGARKLRVGRAGRAQASPSDAANKRASRRYYFLPPLNAEEPERARR